MTNVQKYAEIKKQIVELENELLNIKDEVFSEVMSAEGETIATDLGVFKIKAAPKKWTYSEKLTQAEIIMKEKIKSAKKIEELDGTAIQESAGGQLVFTLNK